MARPNETVLQSKLCGSVLCSSGFLVWASHKDISLPLPPFLAGNDLLNSLLKHQSNVLPRQSGAFRARFGQVNSPFCVSRNFFSLHFGPTLKAVFVTLSSFKFIPSLVILLPGKIHLVWLGFK